MDQVAKKKILAKNAPTKGVGRAILYDFLNVTWQMATPVLLGALVGWLIGAWLGVSKPGFLVGVVLGFLLGLGLAIRLIIRMNKEAGNV